MKRTAVAATVTVVLGALGVPALAGTTASAPLVCGDRTVEVTGFGRGQVLQAVDGTSRFVVTRAVSGDAPPVFDNPGQAGGDDVVECTATSPTSGRTFVFEGFFTPLR